MKNIYLHRIWILISVLILTISHTFATDVTISVANDTWTSTGTSRTGGTTSVTKSGITVSSTKGFKDGTTAIREYSGCEITVSSSVGNITKIAFTSTASGTSNNGPSKISLKSGQSGSYSYSGKVGTWTYATGANSVVFSASAQFRWTQVVVTYSGGTTYTVTYNANGGSGSMSNGTGASVTIADCSFTAPSGKTFSKWNTNSNGTGTDYAVGASVTQNLNLYAIWIDIPQYTVNWYVNGSVAHSQTGYEGATLTSIPTPTSSDCDGSKSFVGWTSTANYSHASTAPAFVSPTTIPNGGANYYAVFATASAGGTTEWVETAIEDISGSDIFVIATPGGYAVSNNNGTSSAPSAVSITVSAGKITSTVTDEIKWNLGGNSTDGYIFYPNGSTTTWLYCSTTATSGSNNNIRVGTGDRKHWKADNDGDYATNDNYTDRWLCNYNDADFRGYVGSSVTSDIVSKFYKKSGGTSYSDYETNCCTPLGQINGPINLTHTETSSSVTVTVGTSYTDYNNVSGYIFKIYDAASAGNLLNTLQTNSNSAADRSQTFTGLTASTNYWVTVTAKGDGSTYCATSEESARVQVTTSAAACVDQFSLHTGTKGGSDWVYNKCFVDADWGASDDAIYVGEFPSTNECYVGYAGSNSYHGAYWAVGGIKTYDLPNGRTLGWNSGNYYSDYPATALGTFHIYKNSTDENYYLRFKPTSYVLRTGSDGTSWTSRDMTVSGINSNYYESDFVTLTSTLISEHAYVDLKANNGDGHVWCNFSNDRTASGNVKVKNGASTFRATDLQASDNGTYGKFQIDITQDVDNWKLAFVPYFHITYNANGGTGSTEASSYVEVGSTAAAAANGFTAPAHTSFGGWATSAANAAAGTVAYAAGANITLTADVELFAIWTPEANATITLNNYTGSATTTGYYAGDSFTLPSTNSYSCNDKTFVGWSTVEIATPSATKPASNFYEPGASVTLGATNTFYAVFAEGEDVEDELNNTNTVNSTSSSYSEWSDVSVSSDAVYAGQSAGEHSSIQLRSNNSNSGIVTTTSGGKATKVVVEWNSYSTSGRVLDIYGKNSAYEKATDLYNASNQGTKLGSITYGTSTELTITGDYAYIGLRSNSGAMYIDKITITWSSATNYSTNCVACNEVTVSYTAPSNGNAMTVKKGSTTISSGDAVKTCSAVDLTVTLTPAAHFTADGLTAKIGSTDMVQSHTGNVYTVTIPQDATGTLNLTPTFTAETPLTITFDVPTGMGTAGTIGTIYSGDNFDFPNVTGYDSDCVDFIGWVDATSGSTFPNDGTATSEPTGLFKYNDNSGAVTTDKTYKAVYGEKVTDYAESYAKVTSAQSDYSGKYLIVCESAGVAFDGSLSTLDATDNKFAVTASAGSITTLYSDKEWTITKTGDNYTIKSASGYYIGKTTTGNGLSSSTSDAYTNTISVSSGTATITSTSQSLSLKYNNATNQNRFRYYGSGQQDIQLYKYGMNEVVTYTYTTAPACGDKYFVTLASVTGGAPTASPKAAADGTTINIVANPNNGYTFTSWTITKDADDSNVTSTLLGANSATASTSFTMPAYDVTVTAAYSITNYTITYNNLNGASNTNPMSYTVATADINLADPGERSGYVFKGWYDDAVYTNRVTTIANGSTGDISLYAKWAVGYTITWQNGVGATNPTPTGIEDGQSVGTLPVPTGSCELNGVEYSNFVGWYTGTIADVATDPSEAGTLITSATVPNGNVTYHAVYTNMPDYSSTHTSNVTLPSQSGVIYTAKVKVGDADDAPQYDAIKIGSNSTKTSSFNFTVPSGTTRITVQGAGWSGKTTSITLATSVGTISPSTAQSLDAQSGATGNSPFTITSNTTLTFNLTGVTSEATITLSNSGERVVVWGINASSASGSEIGYITQCCDNMLSAPVMNTPTVRTSTAITLSWNAVANATGYKVSWNGGDWEDVGTTTTYAKTSLEPETDYAYRVIAKYTTPYCGATPVEGVVSTKPVYTVTYAKGTGTGSCSANGTVPAVATYEAGQVVTIVANPFTLAGNTFAEWVVKDASDNTVTVTNGQFTMPESNVTITATWTAKQDRFFDRMHDGTDATHGGVDDGNGHYYIVREGCQYVMPTLTDDDTGTDICHTSHYKLLGWVAESHINTTDGTIKADALDANGMVKDNLLYKPGVSVMTANNQTFYAVWAKVVE